MRFKGWGQYRTSALLHDVLDQLVSFDGIASSLVARPPRLPVAAQPDLLVGRAGFFLVGLCHALQSARRALRHQRVTAASLVAEIDLHKPALQGGMAVRLQG